MTLKTIEEHEIEFWLNNVNPIFKEIKNGISCPNCGEELFTDLTMVLTSNPPQRRVFCKSCNYTGSIH